MTRHILRSAGSTRIPKTLASLVAVSTAVLLLTPAPSRSDDLVPEKLFDLVDEIKAVNDEYDASTQKKTNSEFKKYDSNSSFWAGGKLHYLKKKVVAERKVGVHQDCEGYAQPIIERAYAFEGFLVRAQTQSDLSYWTAPFESEVLLGLRSGMTRDQVKQVLGDPFKQTSRAMAWACKDPIIGYDLGPTVYYDCLRVFFDDAPGDSKVIGAAVVRLLMCG